MKVYYDKSILVRLDKSRQSNFGILGPKSIFSYNTYGDRDISCVYEPLTVPCLLKP